MFLDFTEVEASKAGLWMLINDAFKRPERKVRDVSELTIRTAGDNKTPAPQNAPVSRPHILNRRAARDARRATRLG